MSIFENVQKQLANIRVIAHVLIHAYKLLHVFADVLLFVDSSASEGVLIKNYSSSPALAMIAAAFWDQCLAVAL